jgi:hypothetical protein
MTDLPISGAFETPASLIQKVAFSKCLCIPMAAASYPTNTLQMVVTGH